MNHMALGYQELLIILVILLLLFGGSRLPQLASGLGKSIRSFKRGMDDGSSEDELEEPRRRDSLRAGSSASSIEEDRIASNKATLNRPQ